jgi:acylphosphatase
LPSARRVRLEITGIVQGVFFRESARREATRLGLTGFVRNEPDGSVTAEAEGDSTHLDGFVEWCGRGPPFAEVERIRIVDLRPTGRSTGFTIAR